MMTQQEMADALGVSRVYICSVEQGRKPFSLKLKRKIDDFLKTREPEPRQTDDKAIDQRILELQEKVAALEGLSADVAILKKAVEKILDEIKGI